MDKSTTPKKDLPKKTAGNTDTIKTPTFTTVPVKKNNTPLIIAVALAAILLAGGLTFLVLKPKPEVIKPVSVPEVKTGIKPITLQLTSPGDGELAVNDEILVKGKTLPNSTVMIYTESDQTSVLSNSSGDFESTVKLTSGINSVNVSAFTNDGQEKSLSIGVVYDTPS